MSGEGRYQHRGYAHSPPTGELSALRIPCYGSTVLIAAVEPLSDDVMPYEEAKCLSRRQKVPWQTARPDEKGLRSGLRGNRRRAIHDVLTRIDPNLTLTRTQCPAIVGNTANRKPYSHTVFANPCNGQQPLTALVAGAGVSGSSPLVGSRNRYR